LSAPRRASPSGSSRARPARGAARVHGDLTSGRSSEAPTAPALGLARERERLGLRDAHREAARGGAVGQHRDARRRDVEAARGEVAARASASGSARTTSSRPRSAAHARKSATSKPSGSRALVSARLNGA
jgi:hypothetical protein